MENYNGRYQFFKRDTKLTERQLASLLNSNRQSAVKLQKSQSSKVLSSVCSYAGGFLIGWPIGTAIAGGKPNWILAGVGAGLVGIAIPVGRSANRSAEEAVETYNAASGARTSAARQLILGTTGTGVGIALKL